MFGSITYFNADGSIHETVTFNNQERYLESKRGSEDTRYHGMEVQYALKRI